MLLINAENLEDHRSLMHAVHVDRKKVFVDWLGWNVPHDDVTERDEFDDRHAEYLVLRDQSSGRHMASLRLLRTDRRHILGDLFPHLCDEPPPRSPLVREITRLCVSPDCPADQRVTARRRLLSALAEYGVLNGLEGYTLVSEASFLPRVAAVGWRCEMLGMPILHEGGMIGAMPVRLDAMTISDLRRTGVYEPQLRMTFESAAA